MGGDLLADYAPARHNASIQAAIQRFPIPIRRAFTMPWEVRWVPSVEKLVFFSPFVFCPISGRPLAKMSNSAIFGARLD
jgi:hypothetical protein